MGVFAQTSIPNGDFEDWANITFKTPTSFAFSSNFEIINNGGGILNVNQTTDKHSGTYAIQLSTIDDGSGSPSVAYIVNGQPTTDNPFEWTGSQPINETPSGISGYFKYNQTTADSALYIITFSKAGTQIGIYVGTLGGNNVSYTPFNIVFSPALAITPDSVTIAFASSNLFSGTPMIGSELFLDSIAFTGITSQPTWLDSDFESWGTVNINIPDYWYTESESGMMTKTSTSAEGASAVQLTTGLGKSKNGQDKARAAKLSNGYYPDNCNGNCQELGGSACSNKNDTLVFKYKYIPSSLDTAEVRINLKQNGTQFYGNNLRLLPTSSYKTAKIGWDAMQQPDSILITFESSIWGDSALVFIGSTLFIDDIHFQSDRVPTLLFGTTTEHIKISPNPASDAIELNINGATDKKTSVKIYNTNGQLVKSASVVANEKIDVRDLDNGNYIIFIKSSKSNISQKLVIKH